MIKRVGRWLPKFSVAVALLAMTMSGCTSSMYGSSNPSISPEMGPVANLVGNFEDIELPVDLKWNSEKSMAIRTDSFKGGILNYSGRVELSSLKDFIITSMENKKWKLVGEAQYKNVLLAFTKPNRTCMVVLDEGVGGSFGTTSVTLYVTVDIAAAGQLNPFGEPINN
jgi:hypothetical protein